MKKNNVTMLVSGLLLISSSVASALGRDELALSLNALATLIIGGYYDKSIK